MLGNGPFTRTITMVFERETKNTYRFAEAPDGDRPKLIGVLYVQKAAVEAHSSAYKGRSPLEITVTITDR